MIHPSSRAYGGGNTTAIDYPDEDSSSSDSDYQRLVRGSSVTEHRDSSLGWFQQKQIGLAMSYHLVPSGLAKKINDDDGLICISNG